MTGDRVNNVTVGVELRRCQITRGLLVALLYDRLWRFILYIHAHLQCKLKRGRKIKWKNCKRIFFADRVMLLRARRGDCICMRSTEHTDTHYARYARRPWQWPLPLYIRVTLVLTYRRLSPCVLLIRRQDNKIVRGEPPTCFPRKNKHLFFTIFMRFAYDNVIANRKYERFIVSLYLEWNTRELKQGLKTSISFNFQN